MDSHEVGAAAGAEAAVSSNASSASAATSTVRESSAPATQPPQSTSLSLAPSTLKFNNGNTTPSIPIASSVTQSSTPSVPASGKIYSRNANGTLVFTSSPGNEAELQLYRVMQRASLLAYYDTLLEMGGDDVQQLCDAGEEEFLEIMALVGMASKPLHVRRLQKALQEWVTNPGLFQVPLLPPVAATPSQPQLSPCFVAASAHSPVRPLLATTTTTTSTTIASNNQSNTTTFYSSPTCNNIPSPNAKDMSKRNSRSPPPQNASDRTPSISPGPSPGSPLQLTPVLMESQVSRLADAAEALVRNLPQFEPKPHNTKKKICRDLENVMNMTEEDPRRMDEIRKYAAIYGRFDCKRKPEKPLTLHEVSVNEAAAQICRFAPALLTRRDELFPLARQVVRDSGYHYSKTHSSLTSIYRANHHKNGDDSCPVKRPRLEPPTSPSSSSTQEEIERQRRQERLETIADELRRLGEKTEELVLAAQQVRENNDLTAIHSLQQQMEVVQNKQTKLLLEQSDLLNQPLPIRFYRRSSTTQRTSNAYGSEGEKPDTDDTDSQLSFSNASSPCQDSRDSLSESHNGKLPGKQGSKQFTDDETVRYLKHTAILKESETFDGFVENRVQVIAASGGNIIAVANPALTMSPSSASLTRLRSESPISLKIERPASVTPE